MGASTARGNRIYRYSDNDSVVVKASGTLATAADPLAAEALAAAQTSALLIRGVTKIDYIIDVTSNTAPATFLYVKFRFSDKESPDVTVPADWGYVMTDNIDAATGISTVQEYMVKIDLQNVNGTANPGFAAGRRYVTRIEQISGIYASAIVYADAGNVIGSVTAVRHG